MPDPVHLNLAYLSLGSNVGDRQGNLDSAINKLKAFGRVVSQSSIYETEPVEFTDQEWFLNCALAFETNETPEQFMADLLNVEEALGRVRVQKKGPRTIDIDILLFVDQSAGEAVINLPELSIPHPAMHQRRFVLEPLAEIAPNAHHPVLKKSIQELLNELPAGQVVRKR
jgi:2-amino-4-hydroxy-6-hydroxymethyldihydropteridine diphosphokinase